MSIDLLDLIFREADRNINGLVKNTFKTVDDLSEEELKSALDKKLKEKEALLSRNEKIKAKLSMLFKEDVSFVVVEGSTSNLVSIRFTSPVTGGSMMIRLTNDKFF